MRHTKPQRHSLPEVKNGPIRQQVFCLPGRVTHDDATFTENQIRLPAAHNPGLPTGESCLQSDLPRLLNRIRSANQEFPRQRNAKDPDLVNPEFMIPGLIATSPSERRL